MFRTRWLISLLLIVGIVGPMAPATPPAAAEVTAAPAMVPAPDVEITITDSGFQPAAVTLRAGSGAHWTNRTSQAQAVSSEDGLFDSGSIPPGGGFSMALAIPGVHVYSSTVSSSFQGILRVGLGALPGPDTDPVADHIPDLPFPPADPNDIGTHPKFGIEASRTRLLLGFKPEATVAQANAALQAAGVIVMGGLPKLGLLLVEAPDTADFSALLAAQGSLRAHPAVELAAISTVVGKKVVPQPAEADMAAAPREWKWEVTRGTAGEPMGSGGNWGLEASRLPQAWNLLEAVRLKDAKIDTAVIDGGFQLHSDLSNLVIRRLCKRFLGIVDYSCTDFAIDDHGNHVAGIVGADYDNAAEGGRSTGVSGVNPVARMHGVTNSLAVARSFISNTISLSDNSVEVFDRVLDAAEDGRIPNLRVINYSMAWQDAFESNPNNLAAWWAAFPNPNCGPGMNDDGLPGANQWCTPNNQDDWLKEAEAHGRAALRIADRASKLERTGPDGTPMRGNVIIIQAAGNESHQLCIGPRGTAPSPGPVPCGNAGAIAQTLASENLAEFAWASKRWFATHPDRAADPNPVVVVEAIGHGLARADFSNVEGDVSAPGVGIWSTGSTQIPTSCDDLVFVSGHWYCAMSGTSMAAPHVTGLIGYMLAYSPTLSIQEVRERVLYNDFGSGAGFARQDTSGGAKPRIDAFAALLSIPGALNDLVDVNDYSQDGNRRVFLGRDNVELGADNQFTTTVGFRTARDGQVDMRDFRRFRDAWLQVCQQGTSPEAGCPDPGNFENPGDIALDGADDHPKKDLNFDGCVKRSAGDASCPTDENVYPRFDFNGDGELSLNRKEDVPFKADGSPARNWAEAAKKTDLEMLEMVWDPDPHKTEGWKASDLKRLMISGDLQVHAGDLFKAGAPEVKVGARRTATGEALPVRVLKRNDAAEQRDENFIVVTVPALEEVEIWGEAQVAGETIKSKGQRVTLKAGEDRRVDLGAPYLGLAASDSVLPADGQAQATITATLQLAPDLGVAGRPITLAIAPNTDAGLAPTSGTTNASGQITTTFTAGTLARSYQITATATLADGQEVKAGLELRTAPVLRIAYAWQQMNIEWQEEGTTRWPADRPSTMPDCTDARVAQDVGYCIDQSRIALNPDLTSEGLQRSGVISGTASTFYLTEEISPAVNWSKSTWTLTNPDGSNPRSFTNEARWRVADAELNRYQNHRLPRSVSADEAPDGIKLQGLREVGELGYKHVLQHDINSPTELHEARAELQLVPRGDGSAIQAASDMSRPILFPRRPDGTFAPYQFCATVSTPITNSMGYRVPSASEWVIGATDLDRKLDYEPGDRPMPFGQGSMKVQYAFAAVASYGDTPVIPALPDCTVTRSPVADFDFSPVAPEEGRVVRFFDQSTDPDNNIVSYEWDFGAGSSGAGPTPHHFFPDNGTYTVRLTVTDADGNTDSKTRQIVVANALPDPSVRDAWAMEGEAVTVYFGGVDPGEVDKQSLVFRLTSTVAPFPTVQSTMPAGAKSATIPGLPAGVYPVTLTVTDKDGGSTSAYATVTIYPSGSSTPTSPAPDDWTYITCGATVTVDAEEKDFLTRLNDYRAQNGLSPVRISPSLTMAAERHATDMATYGFLSHTGSDGSDFVSRARDAGYPSPVVGENVAQGYVWGADALLGWRSSLAGHNELMLNPDWEAVGIARHQGSDWYWATSFGDVLDCPLSQAMLPEDGIAVAAVEEPANAAGHTAQAAAPSEFFAILSSTGAGHGPEVPTLFPRQAIAVTVSAPFAPVPPSALAPSYPPVPAFTISKASPPLGQPVTFANLSRDGAGAPVAAVLDLGDGSAPVSLAPGATHEHSYATAGSYTATLTATDASGAQLAVSRAVPVAPLEGAPAAAFTAGKGTNVAQREAGASIVSYSSAALSYPPENAIDFSSSSLWRSGLYQTTNQWLKVALAGSGLHVVEKVVLNGYGYNNAGPRNFEVRCSAASDADADFTTVVTGTTPYDFNRHEYSFPPRPCRYVQLFVLDNWGNQSYVQVSNFEVWTRDRQGGIVSLPEGGTLAAAVVGYSSRRTGYSPDGVIKKIPENFYFAQSQTTNQWIDVELQGGRTYTVDRVRLQSASATYAVKDFEIRVSTTTTDAADFQTVFSGTGAANTDLQEFSFAPAQARYIRLLIKNAYSTSYIYLRNFQVLTPDWRNVAQREPQAAVVVAASSNLATAERAIDFDAWSLRWPGSTATVWQASSNTNQWIKVLLTEGAPFLVDRVRLQSQSSGYGPRDFQIRVSNGTPADADFTTVLTGTLPNDTVDHWFTFPPVPAKFVQLYVSNNYSGSYISVRNFEVYSPQMGGATLPFEDRSTAPGGEIAERRWDFGDGSYSTDREPLHSYAAPGTYTVTLAVTGTGGLGASYSMPYTVLPSPAADFTSSPQNIVEGGYASFTSLATATDGVILGWLWRYRDTSSTSPGLSSVYFNDSGAYPFSLSVVDSRFLTSEVSKTVSVANLPPTVDTGPDVTLRWGENLSSAFAANRPSVNDPGQIDRESLICDWDFGDGGSARITSCSGSTYAKAFSHAYAQPGTYTVTLTVTDKDGGSASGTLRAIVTRQNALLNVLKAQGVEDGGAVTVAAKLWDRHAPATLLPGRTITFSVGSQSVPATTDAYGVATAVLSFTLGVSNTVSASFAGDDLYDPATDSASFNPVAGFSELPAIQRPGSRVVALVPDEGGTGSSNVLSTYGFSGGYAPFFVNLDPAAIGDGAQPDPLAYYDTVVLNRICDIGTRLASTTFRDRLERFVAGGGKLVIWDSECTGTDYSRFFFPFTTSNPGNLFDRSSGRFRIVEDSTLGSGVSTSPYYINAWYLEYYTNADEAANVFLTYDPNWCVAMEADNALLAQFKPASAYASLGRGLIIYSGLSRYVMMRDASWGGQYSGEFQLAKIWELELKQPWNPSGLVCTTGLQATIALTAAADSLRTGSAAVLTATVILDDGLPLAGAFLRAEVSGANSALLGATTDSGGVAVFSYTGQWAGDDTIVARLGPNTSNAVTISWSANSPPVLAPIVSRSVNRDSPLAFRVTATDAEAPPQRLAFTLDPGAPSGAAIDALSGIFSWTPTAAQIGSHNITVRVTDDGAPSMSDAKSFTVTVVDTGPDFALQLSPPSQILPPGGSASFLVLVDSIDGFQSPVSLTVPSLPAGVTASFSANPVTPPGSATLTLSADSGAASGAASGDFTLEVAGTSGGVTHTTSGDVGLNFGLVPVCYGAFAGMVTDRETGAPIPGVGIYVGGNRRATTDASGHYAVSDVALGYNNAAASYPVSTQISTEYWGASASAIAACGQVTVVNLPLVSRQTGTVSGVVYEGIADPSVPTVVTPTVPLSGAVVSAVNSGVGNVTTGADGLFQLPPLDLNLDNAPRQYTVSAAKAGYWSASKNVTVQAGENVSVELALVPVCTASISGTVHYAAPGEPLRPAGNIAVELLSTSLVATTDSEGNFSFPSIQVAYNNGPRTYTLRAETLVDDTRYYQTKSVVTECGPNTTSLILSPPPLRTANYGTLQGHVYDEETGQPLAGAYVVSGAYTDQTGAYSAPVLVGYDDDTSENVTVYASLAGYWPKSATVLVSANLTTTLDTSLLKKSYAWVAGTVRDVATQQPITNATSSNLPTAQPTGADGAYHSPGLELAYGNQPRTLTFSMAAPGYWPKQASATITAHLTTTVDLNLTKICQGANIGGRVLNAWTQQPIEGASVSAAGKQVYTDSAGRFHLADLTVGTENAPRQVTVNVSASGFYPQSKTVTIFCGASITVDFGRSETVFGAIEGTLTNLSTGQPMAGVFVGSEFGGSATTDAGGYYLLSDVPLGDNGAARTWLVTAMPDDFEPQTRPVTVTASAIARLDFTFGTPPPNSPPTITPPAPQTGEAGVAKGFDLGSFTDPAALDSPWSVEVDWGDSTPQVTFTQYLTGSLGTLWHAYATAGSYTVTVTVTDAGTPRLSDAQTFTVTVSATNGPPTVVEDTYGVDEDVVLEVVAPGVLGNDSDPDGDVLTVSSFTAPAHGSLIVYTDGSFVYTPTAHYNGADSFSYTASDGLTNTDPVTVTIIMRHLNDRPIADSLAVATDEDSPVAVMLAGSDIETPADSLIYTIMNPPAHGTLSGSAPNLLYTPDPDYYGQDTFTYTVTDTGDGAASSLVSLPATVTITINPVNDAPVALDDAYSVNEDGVLEVAAPGVLGNDFDRDGDSLTVASYTLASSGTLVVNADGSFRYQPNPSFSGADSFNYTVHDGHGLTATATVALTITPANSAPTAADQSVAIDEDTVVAITLTGSDADGDALSYTIVTSPSQGTLSGTAPDLVYTPNADYHGPDLFTYTVSDGRLDSAVATITITINPVNDRPLLAPVDDQRIAEEQLLTFVVTADDVDLPDDALTFSLVAPQTGASIDPATGVFRWRPAEDQGPGTHQLTVRVSDRDGLYDEATITIAVDEVNRPPVLMPIGDKAVAWGNTLAFTVTATDPDLPPGVLTFSLMGAPAGASIDPSSGQFNWVPTAEQTGTYSFTVAVMDDGTPPLTASETITVTVEKRRTRLVYEGAGSGQYSDPVGVQARLADYGGGAPQGTALAGKTISFTIGSQVATGATGPDGVASATITLAPPAGSPGVAVTFLGDSHYLGDSTTATFAIDPEQATLEYTGDSLLATSSTKPNSTATVNLAATINEAADGSLGDKLDTAEVRFSVFKFNDGAMASAVANCTASVRVSGLGTGVAGCAVALGEDNYVVEIELLGNGYYDGDVELQALTVVQRGEGSTTGGGWIDEPGLGTRSNFGFTVKYLKNGSIQGRSLYIYRTRMDIGHGLRDYNLIVKSNGMGALVQQCTSIDPTVCTATFTGKNTIGAVDRETGTVYEFGGNYQFQVDVTDNGEPGSSPGSGSDRYAIRVWNDRGTYHKLGEYAGATNTQQLAIDGGNIQVHLK